MQTDRRNWLKQMSLGAIGISASRLQSFASPTPVFLKHSTADAPIKLSSNENPYGPSPLARIAISDKMLLSNRYNWELTAELISSIANKHHVTFDNILMGAGSTEILDLVARFAALKGGSFMVAEPTFSYWTVTAQKLGLKKVSVPLTKDKRHHLPNMLEAITPDTNLIYICNPNNPTGTICEREELVTFIKEASKKALVLVDEAYIDFTEQPSLCDLVVDNKNLVIAKTFSKIYGLAGARVGYAVGHTATLEQLSQLQTWPNGSISVISTAAALASFKDEQFVKETYSLNQKVRNYTIEQLERLGITCIASNSNFIYFSLANYKKDFFEQLKKNKIIGTKIYEEQGQWSRITVGTMYEMEKFINAVG